MSSEKALLSAVHQHGARPTPEAPTSHRLTEFLLQVRPRVDQLLEAHGVAGEEAVALLETTVHVLVWKWESIRNREAWLLAVLERKCRLRIEDDPPFSR